MTYALETERAAKVLAQCVTDVFAQTAFIDVQGRDGGSPIEDARCAAINVLSPLSCSVRISFSQATLDRIADSLYGDEAKGKPGAKKNAEDSMLEILNIVSGSFLSSYFGAGTEFLLELPQYQYGDDASPGEQVTRLRMDAEGEPIEVSLNSVRYRY